MREFLKKNIFSALVCLCALGTISYATSLVRPYTAADYAGGTKAVGPKVNSEFDNIVNWLNGANITSVNIASQGIATANLADASVTTAKLATQSVTNTILASSGIKITSSSSVFATLSASPVAITNLSTTITSTGRPIQVSLIPDSAGTLVAGVIDYRTGAGNVDNGTFGQIIFIRGSSTVADFVMGNVQNTLPAANIDTGYTCSSFSTIDNIAAGTYTYTVKMVSGSPVFPATIVGCKLVVREIL